MNRFAYLLAATLIGGCNAAPETPPAAQAPAEAAPGPAATTTPAGETKRATASGVVQSVDVAAKTVTIVHGPVDALGWPGMTMSFAAPGVDLSAIKAGDNVDFEFTSTGMDGKIESISRR